MALKSKIKSYVVKGIALGVLHLKAFLKAKLIFVIFGEIVEIIFF